MSIEKKLFFYLNENTENACKNCKRKLMVFLKWKKKIYLVKYMHSIETNGHHFLKLRILWAMDRISLEIDLQRFCYPPTLPSFHKGNSLTSFTFHFTCVFKSKKIISLGGNLNCNFNFHYIFIDRYMKIDFVNILQFIL